MFSQILSNDHRRKKILTGDYEKEEVLTDKNKCMQIKISFDK